MDAAAVPAGDRPELRQFLLGLAEGMTAANESVDTIYTALASIARLGC